MKEVLRRYILPAVAIIVVIGALMVESWLPELVGRKYAKVLFEHELPAETVLIQKDVAMQKAGGVMVAMILETDLTSEELLVFYEDVLFPFQEKGNEVYLDAEALNEQSIAAVKEAGYYKEGRGYQFVYLVGE